MTFEESPRRERTFPMVASLLLFVAGLLFFVIAPDAPYMALRQCVGVIVVGLSLWLFLRTQVRYVYLVEPDERYDDREDLVVIRLRGARRETVCRLGISALIAMDPETPQTRKKIKEKYHADVIHDYCVDLSPTRAVVLFFEENETRAVVRLQASEALERIFSREIDGHSDGRR